VVISIELSTEQANRLNEIAQPLGLSGEELARAAVADLLARPAADFETAATYLLEKNKELYKRLT
jgi:hypothetical protein